MSTESQTIASRWRALTKRYTSRQELPRIEGNIDGLARIPFITRSFSDFSGAMESVGNGASSELEATVEATVELDDVIKLRSPQATCRST